MARIPASTQGIPRFFMVLLRLTSSSD